MLDALFSGPGLIVVILIWTFALWKASRAIGERDAQQTKTRRSLGRGIDDVSLTSPLFYLGNLLMLAGIAMRLMFGEALFRPYGIICIFSGYAFVIPLLWYCKFNTLVDPKLIHLSIKYDLKTDQAYEDVRNWVQAVWYFEKPIMITLAMGFIALGGILMWQHAQRDYLLLSAFGLQFLLFLRAFCKITTLILRPQRITLRRWLSDPEEINIPAGEIKTLNIWQNEIYRLFRASALEVINTDNLPVFGLVLKTKEADRIYGRYQELIGKADSPKSAP